MTNDQSSQDEAVPTIGVQEAWVAADGNPKVYPTKDQLIAHLYILRNKVDHQEAIAENYGRMLTGLLTLFDLEGPVTLRDGRTFEFRNPHAAAALAELSRRAREIVRSIGPDLEVRKKSASVDAAIEPFVVKHYVSDDRPSLKGNGFDGLTIGEPDEREAAQEFVDFVNAAIAHRQFPREFDIAFVTSHSNGQDKRYEVVFKFPDIHTMRAAHNAWVLRGTGA